MRIMIMGAGALGSVIGGILARDHDVFLVGREAHVAHILRKGLRIRGVTEDHVMIRASTSPADAPSPDLVIVTVKAFDTRQAALDLKPYISDKTPVISLQNGIGNEEILADVLGPGGIIGGTTCLAADLISPGVVRHAGGGDTVIGALSFSGMHDRVDDIAESLRSGGLDVRVSDNIMGEIWSKTISNAAINPLTALFRIENGDLLSHVGMMDVMGEIVDEAVAVAVAKGVKLPCADPLERVKRVIDLTRKNRSSMLQDVERGRKTEIDYINGAICRIGAEVGVPTPVNMVLTELIHFIEMWRGVVPHAFMLGGRT